MGAKLTASCRMPDPPNMKVDFVAEAENRKQALEKIKKKIDRYLERHQIEAFINENTQK